MILDPKRAPVDRATSFWWWLVDRWTTRLDMLEHGGCACGGAAGPCDVNKRMPAVEPDEVPPRCLWCDAPAVAVYGPAGGPPFRRVCKACWLEGQGAIASLLPKVVPPRVHAPTCPDLLRCPGCASLEGP